MRISELSQDNVYFYPERKSVDDGTKLQQSTDLYRRKIVRSYVKDILTHNFDVKKELEEVLDVSNGPPKDRGIWGKRSLFVN